MPVHVSTVDLSEKAIKMLILTSELDNLQREDYRNRARLREVNQKLAETQMRINLIEASIFELKREISA